MVNRCLIYAISLIFSKQIFAQDYRWKNTKDLNGDSEVIDFKNYTSAVVILGIADRDDCQGVLLSKDTVLTSKSCFNTYYGDKPPITKDNVTVSTLNNPADEFYVAEIVVQSNCKSNISCNYAILKLKGEIDLKDNEYAKLESIEPIPKKMRTMFAHKYDLIYGRNKFGKMITPKMKLRITPYNITRMEPGGRGLIMINYVGTLGAPIFTHDSTQLIISGIYRKYYEAKNIGFMYVMYDHISEHAVWISVNSGIDIKKLVDNIS
ncbi:hypothetical protein AYI70_g8365 [Smittium culicis]|uniref:Peptidase S1 domain-containing protein n=1 Tax=Smittium culicis TaxID=133412 RepID=A0A1R1XG93_9FUNG|nr:hypothetical protein AYI70_g8365 [Smittium culicis]